MWLMPMQMVMVMVIVVMVVIITTVMGYGEICFIITIIIQDLIGDLFQVLGITENLCSLIYLIHFIILIMATIHIIMVIILIGFIIKQFKIILPLPYPSSSIIA